MFERYDLVVCCGALDPLWVDYTYHVRNRANGQLRLFKKDGDFAAFEAVLAAALDRVPLGILGYSRMRRKK